MADPPPLPTTAAAAAASAAAVPAPPAEAAAADLPLLWAKGEDGEDLIHSSEEELRYVSLGCWFRVESGVDCWHVLRRRLYDSPSLSLSLPRRWEAAVLDTVSLTPF